MWVEVHTEHHAFVATARTTQICLSAVHGERKLQLYYLATDGIHDINILIAPYSQQSHTYNAVQDGYHQTLAAPSKHHHIQSDAVKLGSRSYDRSVV